MVFGGARNISSLDQNIFPVKIDVSNDQSIENAVKTVSSQTDHLDYLINDAGINKDSATNNHKELVSYLPKLDRNLLLKMFDVNAISPIMVLQKFLPLLSTNAFVVNISSIRASFQNENSAANYGYRASKVALNMLTLCSVFDLPKNVKIFAVHPGNVKTDMNPEGSDLPVEQARKIIDITKNWRDEFNGKFLNFDGKPF